jgi:hypothetical protein
MRKVFLFILCSALMFGGLYAIVFDLLYASAVFTLLLFGAACMAVLGGYLIWTDFIAPSLGIRPGKTSY